MKAFTLQAATREETGKAVQAIRRAAKIPAVLYGHSAATQHLTLGYDVFDKVYREAGKSSLIDLTIDAGSPVKALIQDIQRDPVTDRIIHADLHQVRMTEKITADVELVYVGESKAVKEAGGVLVKGMSVVTVESLPQDLPHELQVDISSLHTFEDMIRLKDLPVAAGVTIKDPLETVIANVQPPRSEEELKELEEKVEEKVEDIEKVAKPKKEEEAAEGAAEAAAAPEQPTKEGKK